ncbi:304_t:CDS:2 [Ambispora leptoticha]|uniref:304_t:CDS:1 n=1 Tax=Ambispora leptoticha TaxID=144679 RepID=A0A9N9H6W4_9GLOM|nr:304_t:CDS:2 [Ambispora leptoticha]
MDFLNKIKVNIDIRKGLLNFEYNDQKGKVLIKFIHNNKEEILFEEISSEEEESDEDSEKFKDDDSVEIITKEAWILIETPTQRLKDVNFGDIPLQIIQSIKRTYEIQVYQEGIKIKWKRYT